MRFQPFVKYMKLYEVIYHWNEERGSDNDTIYLVRALDFRSAIEVASHSLSAKHHASQTKPLVPDVVYEIGQDLALYSDAKALPLRGPYVEASYNFGWRTWERKIVDGIKTNDWEEVPSSKEQ
jgi:hypothetical protein